MSYEEYLEKMEEPGAVPAAAAPAAATEAVAKLGTLRHRVFVIDGLNVARDSAFDFGGTGGSARALCVAIEHFLTRGCEVHAVLPRWALDGGRERRAASKLAEAELLTPYLRKQLHLSPAGVDEDAFILQFAQDKQAAVCSNDLYRDHVRRGAIEQSWLLEHRLPFMFIDGQLVCGQTEEPKPRPPPSPERWPRGEEVQRPAKRPRGEEGSSSATTVSSLAGGRWQLSDGHASAEGAPARDVHAEEARGTATKASAPAPTASSSADVSPVPPLAFQMAAGAEIAARLREHLGPRGSLGTAGLRRFFDTFRARGKDVPAIIERVVSEAMLPGTQRGLESFARAHPSLLKCEWHGDELYVFGCFDRDDVEATGGKGKHGGKRGGKGSSGQTSTLSPRGAAAAKKPKKARGGKS